MDDETTKAQPQKDEIDLMPEDEVALDKAWATITQEEIEKSIAWLDEDEHS
jgi:hypothetical protein